MKRLIEGLSIDELLIEMAIETAIETVHLQQLIFTPKYLRKRKKSFRVL